jgi:hypothetical protein
MQDGAFAKGNRMNIGTIRANDRGALTGSIATLTVAMSFALRGVASNHPNARAMKSARAAPPVPPSRLARCGSRPRRPPANASSKAGSMIPRWRGRWRSAPSARRRQLQRRVAAPQRRSGFRVAASANDNPTYLDAA